jgi:oxygen-independent coproporphyrinogen-3 oxidase
MSVVSRRWKMLAADSRLDEFLVPPPHFASQRVTTTYLDALRGLIADHPADPGAALQVYAHVPLCDEKCSFCMYHYSLTDPNAARAAAYAGAVTDLLGSLGATPARHRAAALYVGGGTPSVLSESEMDALLTALLRRFPLESDAGATYEMSPRSATPEKIRIAARHGINRFSFGLQSFDPGLLKSVHRKPTTVDHLAALIETAATAGADDINVDLMVGLIGQQSADLVDSALRLANMQVPSMTLYRYRPVDELDDPRQGSSSADYIARCAAMVRSAVEAAAPLGYQSSPHLEAESVRLFHVEHHQNRPRLAKRSWYRTQHRLDLNHTLVGVGGGALSFSSSRYFRCPHVADFGADLAAREVEMFTSTVEEQVALSVVRELYWERRLDVGAVNERYGVDVDEHFADEIDFLVSTGALERSGNSLVTTLSGGEWARAEKLLYPVAWLDSWLASRPR